MRFLQAAAPTLLLTQASHADAGAQLVQGGRSAYQIVLPADAIPSERHAADELAGYLRRISGAEIPIVPESSPESEHEIVLGNSSRLQAAHIDIDFSNLGQEGFHLETQGRKLFIAGGRPRGTLYGVYTLLEEQFGVRWFTPEVERVPTHADLDLPVLKRTHLPTLEYREVFWNEIQRSGDLAARQRLNGVFHRLEDRHGGRAIVIHPFVHSFDHLIPREMFAQHPDYFPLVEGKRMGGYTQRCLTHPDVLRLSIERVRQWIREKPEAKIFSVSQNDTLNPCACDRCRAIDEAEGSHSATLLLFVNAIAAAIEKEHPDVRIETLAYQYTRKPPRTIRPRHNVIIRLCSIECCFAHPLGACPSEENRQFVQDLINWKPVAPLLYVWDYTTNFRHYQQPFPNFAVLQDNVRLMVQHGVRGIFEQGNYSPGGHGEMGPLRAYLLAKLLWDPETDLARHTREFVEAYYGSAAPAVTACIALMQSQVPEGGPHAFITDPPDAAYLTDALLDGAERLLAAAEDRADNDAIRQRVRMVRLPFWYVRLTTKRLGDSSREDLLERIRSTAREAGITHITEIIQLEDWKP